MGRYVTDTHPLVWHLLGDWRLSPRAQQVFQEADAGLHQIHIPSIVLVEVVYLAERQRVDQAALDRLLSLLEVAPANYAVVPLDLGIVQTLRALDRRRIPEMPDRIIAATARYLGLELLTRDSTIATSGLVGILW